MGADQAHDDHLVVGYDRHPSSHAALLVARELATRLAAQLDVVHVEDMSDQPISPDQPEWEEEFARALASQHEQVRDAMLGHAGRWTYRAARGDPAQILAAAAAELRATMIIVGTGEPGTAHALHRLLDGSVLRRLIRHQPCPVLVVPPPEARQTPERRVEKPVR